MAKTEGPYRAQLPIPPDPYLVAWHKIQRAKKVAVLVLVGFVAVELALGWAPPPIRRVAIFLMFFVVGALMMWYLARFRCPHCGERFFVRGRRQSSGHKVCKHCGIPVGTPSGWSGAGNQASPESGKAHP